MQRTARRAAADARAFGHMGTPVQIGYLADHQEFIPTLAQWHHREWAYLRPGDSLEARTARLRGSCGHREIPTVIVSFTGGTLVGSAMRVIPIRDASG